MIDNDEARKTWNELVRVAAQPLARAIEMEAYFEQFRGDDSLPCVHEWRDYMQWQEHKGTCMCKKCAKCGLIEC